MKNNLTYLAIAITFCMMLFGCLTEKKAVKQIAKISHKHPEVLANECGKRYPPIDSIWEKETFIEGEPIVMFDTVTVDCDSALKVKLNNANSTFPTETKIKVPIRTIVKTDTFYKNKFQQVENTAMIEANRLQINKLENENIELLHARKIWMWIAIGLSVFTVLRWVVKRLKSKFTFNIF